MISTFKNPIIDSGFIAKNFQRIKKKLIKSNAILYAAGISDSKIVDKKKLIKEFSRIKSYLKNFDNKKKFIYISTFTVFDPLRNKSPYIVNKMKIENFLKEKNINYLILRFPEIIGKSKNKKTLINFIYDKIKKREKFELWKNSLRNIVDIEDVVKTSEKIILNNYFKKRSINIISKHFYSAENIVKIIEVRLKKKANYRYLFLKKTKLKKFEPYYIKNNFKKHIYIKKIIKKYY